MTRDGNEASDFRDSRLRLRDGRTLGFRESGDPDGFPVIFLHGLPGSRFQCPDESFARELGARLIAPERPGFGLSDATATAYTLRSCAADIAELADALAIPRFALVGFSLSGAFAMACASELPRRVASLGLVSSIAPLDFPENWEGWGNVRAFYELARSDTAALARAAEPLAASAEVFVAALANGATAADRFLLERSPLRDRFLRDARETLRHGIGVALHELVVSARSWDFNVADIRVPTSAWHGLDDLNMPPAMARFLAATIPGCRLQMYAGEGHLLLFPRWREILATVIEAASRK